MDVISIFFDTKNWILFYYPTRKDKNIFQFKIQNNEKNSSIKLK
jgi:hypothetical protein